MTTAFQNPLQHHENGWYALHVRPRFESTVSTALRGKGYEEFLPTYRTSHHWSDRHKEFELPLFPGYLFARFDVRERLPVLKSPGVITVVGVGKTPVPISEEELDSIRAIVRSGLPVEPWELVTVGTRVLIEAGPLAGLEGIALSLGKKFRLVVSVPLLQRSVAVEIKKYWVTPVREAPPVRARAMG